LIQLVFNCQLLNYPSLNQTTRKQVFTISGHELTVIAAHVADAARLGHGVAHIVGPDLVRVLEAGLGLLQLAHPPHAVLHVTAARADQRRVLVGAAHARAAAAAG